MANVLESVLREARRTAQPYAFTIRAALAYVLVAGLVLGLLAFLRLTVVAPDAPGGGPLILSFAEYVRGVDDELSAALIATIVVALLLLLTTTPNQGDRAVSAIDPWNIHPALMESLSATKNYWFRGRSGRFLRDTVLPTLNENARADSTQRSVHLLLPDPCDVNTMTRYAEYRNSLSMSAKDEPWTERRIQNEILATILRAVELSSSNQFLKVDISLSSIFALYRSDLSDGTLIMTREEPKWPALMCRAGSLFYASFLEEMRIAHNLGRTLNVSAVGFGLTVQPSNVPSVLTGIGLQPLPLEPQQCQAIVDAMRRKSSPYG